MNLEKTEIEYLQNFLKITDKNGVHGLVSACESRQFSMVSLREIIERIVEHELNPKMSKTQLEMGLRYFKEKEEEKS